MCFKFRRYYRGKRRILFFIIFFFISILFGLYIKKLSVPYKDSFFAYAENIADKSLAMALENSIKSLNIGYDDLIHLKTDTDGNITALTSDSIMLSQIKSNLAVNVEEELEKNNKKSISVSLGAVQQNPIISSYMPKLKLKIYPISAVIPEFEDEFREAGINQVRHSIYVVLKMDFEICADGKKTEYNTKKRVLLADTVIVGKVPSICDYNGLTGKVNKDERGS